MSARYVLLKSANDALEKPAYRARFATTPNEILSLSDGLQQCPIPFAQAAKPPAPINIWAPLSIEETTSINQWLSDPAQGFNLTRNVETSVLSDNVVFIIEVYPPKKAEALAYLSAPEKIQPPSKHARVTIHHGASTPPEIKDYLVGPLPLGKDTTITPLTDIYHRDDIPFNAYGLTNMNFLFAFFKLALTDDLAAACEDLFGASARGLPSDTLIPGVSGPFSFDGTFRRVWLSWKLNVPGSWLLPLNFFWDVDMSGTDPNKWKILKVVYDHHVFDDLDAFINAWKDGKLVRRNPPNAKDTRWATRLHPDGSEARDLDHLPGPRQVSFGGLRFRVDRELQYVSWMGWGMYLSFDRDMGLSLWDIRLKGERIIYQLAPQEALSQYAGNDPMQATTAWLDRYWGMGGAVRDLLPNYDCPAEAVFLPATIRTPLETVKLSRAICVFEHDSGKPITRHTGYEKGEFGAVKGYQLVIRSISTIDKSFDYTFALDGSLEVRVSASGYLQAGYWEPTQDPYGSRIRDTTMGNLHDHSINFKVDFDIAGTSNSLLSTKTVIEEVEFPWLDPEDIWGNITIQQKIVKEYITTEDESKLWWPKNFQGMYAVVNQERKNKWGYPRGYAIHPGSSPIHNTVVGSKRMLNNANWARYNMAVTKRKDKEPSSSSMWNMNLPSKPMVDFHKFFDGESLVQEDLVAWINVGTHHLPQAEDSPNTKTNVATSSFLLTPLNYFDSDISMDSLNAIVLEAPANGDMREFWGFDDNSVEQDSVCMPSRPSPFQWKMPDTFDLDGNKRVHGTVEDARKKSGLIQRIKLG
ncbi:copper amine oxidase [Flagelloscypha sp. PMI_526]|nr:copper amine oxidase [Flagelloscypha sp. PMI_526]